MLGLGNTTVQQYLYILGKCIDIEYISVLLHKKKKVKTESQNKFWF